MSLRKKIPGPETNPYIYIYMARQFPGPSIKIIYKHPLTNTPLNIHISHVKATRIQYKIIIYKCTKQKIRKMTNKKF